METNRERKQKALDKIRERLVKKGLVTDAPHEIADSTEIIRKGLGFEKEEFNKMEFGRGYWLGKVKQSGFNSYVITKLVEEMGGLDGKYSKGGWLTNKLIKKI